LSGAIAQLGERLPCTQEVDGSIPSGSTKFISFFAQQKNNERRQVFRNAKQRQS
jgi:hypothetical protein